MVSRKVNNAKKNDIPWSVDGSPEGKVETRSRELSLAGLGGSRIFILCVNEPETVERRRIIIVLLILHDGLLRNTQPVVRRHLCTVGEVERVHHFTNCTTMRADRIHG